MLHIIIVLQKNNEHSTGAFRPAVWKHI